MLYLLYYESQLFVSFLSFAQQQSAILTCMFAVMNAIVCA